MQRSRRIWIVGLAAALWMVGLIAGGIAYRVYFKQAYPEKAYPNAQL